MSFKLFRCLFLALFIALTVTPSSADLYLYDDFNDGQVDTLKWWWEGAFRSHSIPGVTESLGVLTLEKNSEMNESYPKIYFSYPPDVIQADVNLIQVTGNFNPKGGTQINVVWFYDENTGQRVVSKIGINYQEGKANFSALVRSGDKSVEYKSAYLDCFLNQTYQLRMERRNQSVHFFIDGSEWLEAACYLPSSVVDYGRILQNDRANESNCHMPASLNENYFLIDNFFWSGETVTVKSSYDNIFIDRKAPEKGRYQVTDPFASYIDIPDRTNTLETTDDPILTAIQSDYDYENGVYQDCSLNSFPVPIGTLSSPLSMPGGYYQDDPEGYEQARQPLTDYERQISKFATLSTYRSGDSCAASLLDILDYWARNGALLNFEYTDDNHGAWYEVNWTSSATAFAYATIKSNPNLDSIKKQRVETWLRSVVQQMIDYSGGFTDNNNNHLYWRGVSAAMTGVVSDDDDLFDFGVRVYLKALEAMNMDGSFPLEMMRGRCAIHYQNFAVWPLVFIAEIASRQGYDLYGETVDGKNLRLAIRFLMDILAEPQILVDRGYTATNDQDFLNRDSAGFGWNMPWVEPYQRRFDDTQITDFINRAGISRQDNHFKNPWTGGPATLWFHKNPLTVSTNCDISGDGQIGLEEIIYYLQILAGMR